jgi:hypothetical protein
MSPFWILRPDDQQSDYRHSYVNGAIEYAYRLPTTGCRTCSRPRTGTNVQPYPCPDPLRNRPELRKAVLPPSRYEPLAAELASLLRPEDSAYIAPGQPFQPGILDIPSTPEADFLWPELEGPLVSLRIRDILAPKFADDLYFTPVAYRRVGKRSPKAKTPIPRSGEPEDVIAAVPLHSDSIGLSPYFRLNVRKSSGLPPDAASATPCPECGYPDHPARQQRPLMTPAMWKGASIFYLATTLYIVVTDQVRDALAAIKPTNLTFASAAV